MFHVQMFTTHNRGYKAIGADQLELDQAASSFFAKSWQNPASIDGEEENKKIARNLD